MKFYARYMLFFVLTCILNILESKKTLVLLENWSIRETHSIFFSYLKENNYDLLYKKVDDNTLSLVKYGEFLYDNLIIFAPAISEFGGKIDVQAITNFVDGGGNVLVTGGSDLGEAMRELGSECGVEFDEENTAVIDHLSFDVMDGGKHTLLVAQADQLIKVPVIVGSSGNANAAPLIYRGIGMTADADNPLLLPILRASGTAYSFHPDKKIDEFPGAVGRDTLLLVALQARNNARMLFSGSLDFFSDEFFTAPVQREFGSVTALRSGNQALSEELISWLFKKSGVLRVGKVVHRRMGEQAAPTFYTILEQVEYRIQIETLDKAADVWVPYDAKDVQLEFQRIDPFVRVNMKRENSSSDVYVAQFKLPDVYGVYQFIVNYNRLGWTHVYSAVQVSVHPPTHTQYERFIVAAFPYYAATFSMMLGVFLFSCLFLHARLDEVDGGGVIGVSAARMDGKKLN